MTQEHIGPVISQEVAIELGSRLYAHRRRLGISLRQAAKILRQAHIGGIPWDVYAIVHVEKGRLAVPNPTLYMAILDALSEAAGEPRRVRKMNPRMERTLQRIRQTYQESLP